jgi:hypothetical protein
MAYVEGERSFPSFEKCLRFGLSAKNVLADDEWRFYSGIDISSKSRPGTVLVTVGVNRQNVRVIAEVRYLSDPAQLPGVLEVSYTKWNQTTINVENNATQDALLDLWKIATSKKLKLPFKAFTTGANKAHPDLGLPSLEAEFANDMWVIPIEADRLEDLPESDPLRHLAQEFLQHPFAATTDGVMATWFAREAIGRKRYMTLGSLDDISHPPDWYIAGETPGLPMSSFLPEPATPKPPDDGKPKKRRLSFQQ